MAIVRFQKKIKISVPLIKRLFVQKAARSPTETLEQIRDLADSQKLVALAVKKENGLLGSKQQRYEFKTKTNVVKYRKGGEKDILVKPSSLSKPAVP